MERGEGFLWRTFSGSEDKRSWGQVTEGLEVRLRVQTPFCRQGKPLRRQRKASLQAHPQPPAQGLSSRAGPAWRTGAKGDQPRVQHSPGVGQYTAWPP